jgi:hypothetical protein
MIVTGNFGTFYTWFGFDPNTATILWTFSYLTWFAYILAWVNWLQTRSRYALATVVMITVIETSYLMLISASKTFLSYIFLYPIMAFYLWRKKLPLLALISFLLVIVLFIFPYIAQFRALSLYLNPEGIDLRVISQISREAIQNTTDISSSTLQGTWESFLGRWHGFESLASIMTKVPEKVDYLYWRDAILLPFALIPRFLLPWKPESKGGEIFSFHIYEGGSSVSPYPIGEGYFNFGAMGIIILMVSLGILQRWFYSSFYKPRESQPLAVAIYIYLFFTLTNFDSWLINGYIGAVQNAFILFIVYFLLFRPPLGVTRQNR